MKNTIYIKIFLMLLIAASIATPAFAAGDNLTISANPGFVYIAEPADVTFTVMIPGNATCQAVDCPSPSDPTPVSGAVVTVSTIPQKSGNTGADGKVVLQVIAGSLNDITATASYNGSSVSTVIKVRARTRLKIVADAEFVNVGIARVVNFTVTEYCPQGANACTAGSVVNDSTVQLSGAGVSLSNVTDQNGHVSFLITATSSGNITATASKQGYARGDLVIKAMGPPALILTADKTTVTVGKNTSVTFTVKFECGTNPDFDCKGNPLQLIPVKDVNITLSGLMSGGGNTTPDGTLKFNINATHAGTITATARKDGYADASLNIRAVTNGTTPTPPGGGGNPGGSSGSSSSGSGGGGGGGGLTTSEAYSNILKSERRDADLQRGKPVTFSFSTPEFSIYRVAVTGKENEGDVGLRIEHLNGTSSLVNRVPDGIVYSNENVWSTSKRIDRVVLGFRVSNEWISKHGFKAENIAMLRFNDGWKPLEVTITGSDSDYTYFEARSPGLSSFAVSGVKEETPKGLDEPSEVTGINVPEEIPESNDAEQSPGFEALAVLGIIPVVYLLRQRRQ